MAESDLLSDVEKQEGIQEYLQSLLLSPTATDEEIVTLVNNILHVWTDLQQADTAVQTPQSIVAADRSIQHSSDIVQSGVDCETTQQLEAEKERKRRNALLSRYEYEALELARNDRGEAAIVYSDGLIAEANTNSKRVQDQQRFRRDKMKKDHEEKVARDKSDLEKQRLQTEKDKVKRKTVKQEKRRM